MSLKLVATTWLFYFALVSRESVGSSFRGDRDERDETIVSAKSFELNQGESALLTHIAAWILKRERGA
jgi:hypothetical protein